MSARMEEQPSDANRQAVSKPIPLWTGKASEPNGRVRAPMNVIPYPPAPVMIAVYVKRIEGESDRVVQ